MARATDAGLRRGQESGGPGRPAESTSWIHAALQPGVVRRSLRVAGLVGTLLVSIKYADRALAGTLVPGDWLKMALTYLVPYGVATYAAVQAIRAERQMRRGEEADPGSRPAGWR